MGASSKLPPAGWRSNNHQYASRSRRAARGGTGSPRRRESRSALNSGIFGLFLCFFGRRRTIVLLVLDEVRVRVRNAEPLEEKPERAVHMTAGPLVPVVKH